MVTVNAVKLVAGPVVRMYYGPLLKIPFGKISIQFFIGTAFVAIVPKNYGGVVKVTQHHFLYQRPARFGAVKFLPAGQFIQHINAEAVA